MNPIRIVLADDHAVLRAGLKSLLSAEADLEVVGEAGDGSMCVNLVADLNPDVVVMDINMPVCSGLEALPMIRERAPDCKVLVLTMYDDPGYLRTILESGGAGFLLKQSAAEELLTAIRAVHEGGVYVSPRHTKLLLEDTLDTPQEPTDQKHERYDSLSEREAEIFELTALGHSNTEIADMLYLSVKTVETYKARMMRKLDLHSRASLVRLALELEVLQ
ncbi:oxygen regulatory protein NreC [bacterium BMS3Abin02]|nr:oxygen regulatory protein NreC [bacterium BMS3Abin02]GBE22327.1 oxygen regulatory protein NreC [bacterium BMS3Bbin01]HDH24889.1 response regulator transcription factor [Actinomycetota bacterium]HDK44914.1 response regulator transcription factor [Actinomycetota bacterium]HDL49656.1 response regulator transcription factor [Actinomycetota bacterium]